MGRYGVFQFRVSDEDRTRWQAAADERHLSLSEFMRLGANSLCSQGRSAVVTVDLALPAVIEAGKPSKVVDPVEKSREAAPPSGNKPAAWCGLKGGKK